MNPYISVLVLIIVMAIVIALVIYHNSGRNIHESFEVHDSVILPSQIQVHICVSHDRKEFDPYTMARWAKRAGYLITADPDTRVAHSMMKKPSDGGKLYFLISRDDKGTPRLITYIEKTEFTTAERLSAPKFIPLVKISQAAA